jgi:hypothetical protein
MTRVAALVAASLIACSDPAAFSPPLPDAHDEDASDLTPPDAYVPDAGPDAEPPELAELCGAMPVTLDDWEDCYARRVCEWASNCPTYNYYADADDCVAHADGIQGGALTAMRRERARAVEDGRAAIDEAQFTQCLIETAADRCNTAFLTPSCKLRFSGTIADGQPCLGDIECASPGATCARDCADACCEGVCDPADAIGATCESFYGCVPGATCDIGTCFAGDLGSQCNTLGGCDPERYCDLQTHTCKQDLPPGATCTNLLQCGGETSCVGLETSATGTCSRLTEAGDPCDAFCYGNLVCAGGVCKSLPAVGQTCGSVPCLGAGNVCINGRCAPRVGVGVECHDTICAPGLFCTNELGDTTPACAEPGGTGAPARDSSHCASHLCSGNENQEGECLPWVDTCSL